MPSDENAVQVNAPRSGSENTRASITNARTRDGVDYDREVRDRYAVTVQAEGPAQEGQGAVGCDA